MHKETVKAMLPIFHAAGHLPYARAAHLYVQHMEDLTGGCSRAAGDGHFTVRRSMFDAAAEVSRRGHVRPRLTKSSVAQFTLTRRALVDLSAAVEEYSGVHTGTSEQHVELRVGRQEKDCRDLKKFSNWLRKYNPFVDRGVRDNQRVVCLHTGHLGALRVNCHKAVEVGTALMEKMYGKDFDQSLTLKGRVIPLSTGPPLHKAKDAPDQKSQFYFNKMVTLDLTRGTT
ncbi:hypothetical protein FOCC_FOCC015227 [Frankliniella occidentalis]|nr:hypothetical protein FOCC_FOCC015227 [Frankliniella occidentalis]